MQLRDWLPPLEEKTRFGIQSTLSGCGEFIRIQGYSVERLTRFLVALGHDVELVVKHRKRGVAELRVA